MIEAGNRVVITASGQRGEVVGVELHQEGSPWEERILLFRPDGAPFDLSVHEAGVTLERDYPQERAEHVD